MAVGVLVGVDEALDVDPEVEVAVVVGVVVVVLVGSGDLLEVDVALVVAVAVGVAVPVIVGVDVVGVDVLVG